MTILPRSPRELRVVVMGIGTMLAIVVSAREMPRLREYETERRSRANVTIARALRAEQAIHRADRTRVSLIQVRSGLAKYDSALVEGDTPSAASARLASVISDAVDGTEARLGSVTLGVDSTGNRGQLARVTARASLSGELYSIVLVLQTLEKGPPMVAVRELSLIQSQPVTSPTQVEAIQAEIVVEGLYRRAATKRAR
jgi:hypothetical protein